MLVHKPQVESEAIFLTSEGDRYDALKAILQQFDSTTLSQIEEARLLKRTDTKFVFSSQLLPELLRDLSHAYAVLDVDGVRMQRYRTCYYDTVDFKLYHQHHNGQRDRFKLRVRSYLDSAIDFLEVKRKDNHDRTLKSRIRSGPLPSEDRPEVVSFLADSFPLHRATLAPKISNSFYRISLISRRDLERLTIDLDLRFLTSGDRFSLPGLAVAEVKQPRFSIQSAFMQLMRQAGIRATSFSKYCVGAALAYPQLKRNAFKPLLLDIRKMVTGGAA